MHSCQGREYWRRERQLCAAMLHGTPGHGAAFDLEDVHTCSKAKSFDYRVRLHFHHACMSRERCSRPPRNPLNFRRGGNMDAPSASQLRLLRPLQARHACS